MAGSTEQPKDFVRRPCDRKNSKEHTWWREPGKKAMGSLQSICQGAVRDSGKYKHWPERFSFALHEFPRCHREHLEKKGGWLRTKAQCTLQASGGWSRGKRASFRWARLVKREALASTVGSDWQRVGRAVHLVRRERAAGPLSFGGEHFLKPCLDLIEIVYHQFVRIRAHWRWHIS